MQFYSGIALGLIMSRLYQEQYSEIAGNEGYLLVSKTLNALEQAVFNQEFENTEGAIVGFGIALSASFGDSRKDSRVHAELAHQKLFKMCKNIEENESSGLMAQVMYFSVAVATCGGFATECLNAAQTTECVQLLVDRLSSCPHVSDIMIRKVHMVTSLCLVRYNFSVL